jgi:3-oxoacyl-[acyl-carrier protein] reductase
VALESVNAGAAPERTDRGHERVHDIRPPTGVSLRAGERLDLGLKSKVALVTGASSGIGAATARLLAEEGADVVVGYRTNGAGAARSADAVRELGRRAWLCPMDLASSTSVSSAIDRLGKSAGPLDVAVLCAGQNIVTPLQEVTPEEWCRVVEVNLNGPFFVLRAILPLLRDDASIVTVASVAAHTGAPHHAHYAAAKAGLVSLTKSAARALAPRVRVNCVAAGLTLTPMGKKTLEGLSADYATTELLTRRFAAPDEIARCIVFLASRAASFVTGATLDANGGRLLR